MNKKEVIKEAKDLLKKGDSKQDAYLVLKEKYKSPKEIAELLKNIPSTLAIEKYIKWNYTLLALLIVTTAIVMSINPLIGFLIWYGFIIFIVARVLVKYYYWVSMMTGFGLFGGIILAITSNEEINWIGTSLILILIIPSFILSIWLPKKLCPPPVEKKVKYFDKTGLQRLKLVYEFAD